MELSRGHRLTLSSFVVLTLGSDPGARSPRVRFGLTTLLDVAGIPLAPPGAPVPLLRVDDVAPTGTVLQPPWGIRAADGAVHVSVATLEAVTNLAGATREQASTMRDRHDRVPPAENELVVAGLERTPVVSRMARALREATVLASGGRPIRFLSPWPHGRRWAAALTHDIDVVSLWPVFTGLRVLELARKADVGRAARTMIAAVTSAATDPVRASLTAILALEREYDVRGTWFALCGTPTLRSFLAGDLTYTPERRRNRAILASVTTAGHEVGLHGSFATTSDAAAFRAQRARLAALTGQEPAGVRQHFLRFSPGRSPAAMREAGFRYDASFGFPDRNGFRLGVADVVPGWNDTSASVSGIEEAPLLWMDRALSKYAGVEAPDRWIDDALSLAAECERVEGLWVGLWHPNLWPALGYPGAFPAFGRLLSALHERGAWTAPLGEVVSWRTARRSVRVTHVGEGVRAVGTAGTWSLTLEDEHAVTREVVTPE